MNRAFKIITLFVLGFAGFNAPANAQSAFLPDSQFIVPPFEQWLTYGFNTRQQLNYSELREKQKRDLQRICEDPANQKLCLAGKYYKVENSIFYFKSASEKNFDLPLHPRILSILYFKEFNVEYPGSGLAILMGNRWYLLRQKSWGNGISPIEMVSEFINSFYRKDLLHISVREFL